MVNNRYPSENEIKNFEWITPAAGLINYVKRNVRAKTTNTNGFANGFYHLLIIQLAECVLLGKIFAGGLEKLVG